MDNYEHPHTSPDVARAESSFAAKPRTRASHGPPAQQEQKVAVQAMSIKTFCAAHGIGRTTFYKLLRDGVGPRLMTVCGRTRISAEAAEAWRRQTEATAQEAAASRTGRTKEDRARAREGDNQ